MEAIASRCEVCKDFEIKNFSQYSTSSEVSSEISVSVDDFKSSWKLTLWPMQLDNSRIDDPVNCDVAISLKCLSASSPVAYIERIEISALVKGRENYPKELKRLPQTVSQPTWKDILISRATLLSSSSSLTNDVLKFQLRFSVSNEVLSKSEDGCKRIGENLGKILLDPEHFDTCLITISGVKFFTHSAVLYARSNILKTGKLVTLDSCLETTEDSEVKLESELSSSLDPLSHHLDETPNSLYNTCGSKLLGSPFKRSPLFVSSSVDSSPKLNKLISSPAKRGGRNLTPQKRALFSAAAGSPSKRTQTQLTNYFQRCSSLKNELDGSNLPTSSLLQKVDFLSPIKNSPIKEDKWRRGALEASPSQSRKENTNSHLPTLSYLNPSSPLETHEILRSPCGTKPTNLFQNPKRKLFNEVDGVDKKLTMINVKMSTSVTQELLRWIYTGESTRLAELSRPLLVASIRHEVPGLARATQLHLASIITVENVAEMLLLGHKYKANLLKEGSMNFAIENACDVTARLSWAELSLRYPDLMLEFTRRLASKPSCHICFCGENYKAIQTIATSEIQWAKNKCLTNIEAKQIYISNLNDDFANIKSGKMKFIGIY